jgi:hypothetical protein
MSRFQCDRRLGLRGPDGGWTVSPGLRGPDGGWTVSPYAVQLTSEVGLTPSEVREYLGRGGLFHTASLCRHAMEARDLFEGEEHHDEPLAAVSAFMEAIRREAAQ